MTDITLAPGADLASVAPVMRMAQITLPISDNYGKPLDDVHGWLANELATRFGGFTRHTADGAWRDDNTGKLYVEPVEVYYIAVPVTAESARAIREIAERLCSLADQEAIFTVTPFNTVEIITRN